MKFARLVNTLVGGLLILLPIYLMVLVLLKGMQSAAAWSGRWRCYCLVAGRELSCLSYSY
jgi:hypothetical protein